MAPAPRERLHRGDAPAPVLAGYPEPPRMLRADHRDAPVLPPLGPHLPDDLSHVASAAHVEGRPGEFVRGRIGSLNPSQHFLPLLYKISALIVGQGPRQPDLLALVELHQV